MARLLSPALTFEKNRLQSDHVFSMLFEIDIPGAPAPFRLAAYDQDIVFHGLTFFRFPVTVDSLEEANPANLISIRVTIGNVDQEMQSLLENYWVTSGDPHWTSTVWQIDGRQPDETPFGVGEVFAVSQIVTDLVTAVADMQAEGVTLSRVVPRRRYTSTGGFPLIPRK